MNKGALTIFWKRLRGEVLAMFKGCSSDVHDWALHFMFPTYFVALLFLVVVSDSFN